MTRRRRSSTSREVRGLIASLVFVVAAYLLFASGLYQSLMTVGVDWYVEQLVLPGAVSPTSTPDSGEPSC